MRTDENLSQEVRGAEIWKKTSPNEDQIGLSFSGNERNRWFYNQNREGQRSFADLSTLSGIDSIADGRGFAIWDFNRDGKIDIALSNSNAPHLNLYINQIQSDLKTVAVRFVGGAKEDAASEFTPRDGYGAVITVETSEGLVIKREFRCGEGFAVQNSDTLLIGIGAADSVTNMKVKWPSGIEYEAKDVEAGKLVTFFEHKEDSATHQVESYADGN